MQQKKNSLIRKWGIILLDLLCIICTYYISVNMRFDDEVISYTSQSINLFLIILILLSLGFNYVYTNNRMMFYRNWVLELKTVILYNIYLLVGIIVITFLMHIVPTLSRLVLGYFFLLDVALMFVVRQVGKLFIRKIYAESQTVNSVVLVVEKGLEEETINNFDSGLTYRVTGVLSVDGNRVSGKIGSADVSTDIENLADAMVTIPVDDIMFNIPGTDESIAKNLLVDFEEMGVDCYYVLNMPDSFRKDAEFTRFGEIPVATYTVNEHSSWKLMIKRVFDICVSIVGLILCFIIGIFLVPAIKLESPGPAIFSQIRIGKNGRRFKFYKFRSMYADAEERKKELEKQNQMDGLIFKMDDDPRITKVGKFIRKTSLDEFPQFWNVLKGDMSIIGTRPPTADEFAKYNPHYKRRLSMVPGITGLWQVSGRSDIKDFDEIVKLDLEYIDNWSLTLDIEIFFKTFSAVLLRKGAE